MLTVRTARRAAALAALGAFSLAGAHADVKIVQNVTTENAPKGGPFTQGPGAGRFLNGPSTVYYKGSLSRTEQGETVTITDNEKGQIITLNPAKKTYTVLKIDELARSSNPLADMMDFKVDASVKVGDKAKVVAGKNVKNYTTAVTVAISPKPGSGFPGGDSGPLMTLTITGDYWNADDIKLDSKAMQSAALGFVRNMSRMVPNAKSLSEKMVDFKGLPLSSTTSMSFKSGFPIPGLPDKPIVTKTETVSVSEEDLPDSLFTVPEGFTEVKAPTPSFAPPAGATAK